MKYPLTKHHANEQQRLTIRLLSLCIATAVIIPQVRAMELTDVQASMAHAASGGPIITSIGTIAQRAERGQPLLGKNGIASTTSAIAAMSAPPTVRDDDLLVGLLDAQALREPQVRAQARKLAEAGVAVFVLRGTSPLLSDKGREQETSDIAKTFGAASQAQAAYYRLNTTGVVESISLGVLQATKSSELLGALGYANAELLRRVRAEQVLPRLSTASSRTSATQQQTAQNGGYEGPSHEANDHQVNSNGSSIVLHTKVVRDTSANRDRFIVTQKAVSSIIPAYRYGDTLLIDRFGANWKDTWAYTDAAPYRYEMRQSLEVNPANKPATPKLLAYLPFSQGQTDISLSDKHTTTNQYSIGVSGEISGQLFKAGESNSPYKLGFSVGYTRTNSKETSYAVTVKDYSIQTRQGQDANRSNSMWTLQLSDVLFNQPYVRKQPTKRTPMMDQATLETIAEWEVPASTSGMIVGTAGSAVDMKGIASLKNNEFHTHYVNNFIPESWYPSPRLTIPLDSPILTRTPSVQIRSLAAGRCLVQTGTEVALGICDRTNRSSLWRLDANRRYINLGSGNCLTGGGRPTVQACKNGEQGQEWQWNADRLYAGSPGGWRLFSDGQTISVASDDTLGIIPTNADHHLLKPWSSYPLAPTAGDFLPTLGDTTVRPTIPGDWPTRYKGPQRGEQWDVIPYRLFD